MGFARFLLTPSTSLAGRRCHRLRSPPAPCRYCLLAPPPVAGHTRGYRGQALPVLPSARVPGAHQHSGARRSPILLLCQPPHTHVVASRAALQLWLPIPAAFWLLLTRFRPSGTGRGALRRVRQTLAPGVPAPACLPTWCLRLGSTLASDDCYHQARRRSRARTGSGLGALAVRPRAAHSLCLPVSPQTLPYLHPP